MSTERQILHVDQQIERDEEAEIFLELANLSSNQRQLRVQEHILRALLRNSHISREILRVSQANMGFLQEIVDELSPTTPTSITFKEITMLPPVAGNTLVYTGTLAPSGSQFPAGTTFALVSSDPTVTPTVDATGLIVTIPLPATFVDDPANPFNVVYTASGITPNPSTSPTTVTATITPTIPTPPPLTPTGIVFNQTT